MPLAPAATGADCRSPRIFLPCQFSLYICLVAQRMCSNAVVFNIHCSIAVSLSACASGVQAALRCAQVHVESMVQAPVSNHWAHGVVVSHPLSMREALGSIPSVSIWPLQRRPRRGLDRQRSRIVRQPVSPGMGMPGSGSTNRPIGLMDKASAPGAGESRFESWAGHSMHIAKKGW